MASYEMVLVVDPRLPDEDVETLRQGIKEMFESFAAEVVKEESWGKRRLAYPIQKLNEGKYFVFSVEAGGENPFVEVEKRLGQNENVLRYLTVRTDKGRLRRRGEQGEPEAKEAEA